MDEVVEMLKVECASPPVPTMSQRPPLYSPSFRRLFATAFFNFCLSTCTAASRIASAHFAMTSGRRSLRVECSNVKREASCVPFSLFSNVLEKASAMSSASTWLSCGAGAESFFNRGAIETYGAEVAISEISNAFNEARRDRLV